MLHLRTLSSEEPAVSSISLICSRAASVCALIVPGPLMISPFLSNGGAPVRYRVSPWRTTVLVGALYFSSRLASGSTRMIWRFIVFCSFETLELVHGLRVGPSPLDKRSDRQGPDQAAFDFAPLTAGESHGV